MNPETHLFIIWSNAAYKKDEIISDISTRFRILGIHTVTWDKSCFSENLTRFYGENLPPHSNKEKLCGSDPFTVVVVTDEQPLYRTRMTSKGPAVVNVDMFDSKEMYRHLTGGGHMIHGTNSDRELRHDLVLLTGYSKEDYLELSRKTGSTLTMPFGPMPGERTWDSMEQVLYVLNETVDHVVLRNFQGLHSDYDRSVHGDVDILTSNRYLAKLALNAKPTHRSKRRVQHLVKIGGGGTFFDIRYVGDNYYCKKWEKDILAAKYLSEDGYYRPSDEDYAYSLLYHALVQKPAIADDYREIFRGLFPGCDDKELRSKLLGFLKAHDYSMNEPYDYSVYFNRDITGKGMSLSKYMNKAFHKVFGG